MTVTPISKGLVPSIDVEREMISFVAERLRKYREDYGVVPTSIAVVLVGADEGDAYSVAHSWSPADENKSLLQVCSTAAALLWKRALGL